MELNTKCKQHNQMATVWKVILGVLFALILSELTIWGMLNHADTDVLGICEDQVLCLQPRASLARASAVESARV